MPTPCPYGSNVPSSMSWKICFQFASQGSSSGQYHTASGGYAKKVTLRNNNLFETAFPCVRYFTDTEAGSSGAPVFNDNWEVIALHRATPRSVMCNITVS